MPRVHNVGLTEILKQNFGFSSTLRLVQFFNFYGIEISFTSGGQHQSLGGHIQKIKPLRG